MPLFGKSHRHEHESMISEGMRASQPTTGHGMHGQPMAHGANGSTMPMGTTHGTHGRTTQPMTGRGTYGAPMTGHGTHGSTMQPHHDAAMDVHKPGPAPHTAGPHRHDILNKLDPTVDSQSKGVQLVGPGVQPHGHGAASQQHHQPMTAVGGGNYTTAGSGGLTGKHRGKHDKHMMSAPEGSYGPHSSRMGNAVDPMVDSDMDHRGTHRGAHGMSAVPRSGAGLPGPASKTAGPHSSNLLNKLDPAVDHKAVNAPPAQPYRTY